MKYLLTLFALATFAIQPVAAQQLDYDLSISGQEIYFSKNTLIAGDSIRVYARIRNQGKNDASGYVRFYQGSAFIGDSQNVSVLAGGVPDEVYLDWTVPAADFNIRAEIKGQTPKDLNPANDVAITSLFSPKIDTDHDGLTNDVDPDDDNDGLLDADEIQLGTNPLVADTDGDGVKDGADYYPLDPTRSAPPATTMPAVKPLPAITNTNTASSSSGSLAQATTTSSGTTAVINSNTNTNIAPAAGASVNAPTSADLETLNPAAGGTNSDQPATQPETAKPVAAQLLINTKRINWQTYQFFADPRVDTTAQLDYTWNFGDGETSTRPYPTHQYAAPGNYHVTVSVYDKVKGRTLTGDQTTINISFFNIGNYQLWLVLIGVLALLGIILKIVHKIVAPRD